MALGVGAVAAVIAFSAAAPEVAGEGLATVPVERAPTGDEPTMTAAPTSPSVPPPAAPAGGADDRGAPGMASAPAPRPEAAGSAASTPTATAPGAPASEIAPPRAESKVALMVTTRPPGARIFIDGEPLEGVTPMNVSLDAGEKRQIELVLKKDRFEDLPVALSIGPELGGQAVVVNHTLTRKKVFGGDPFKDL